MISEFFADGMIPWSPILLSLKVAGLATAASFCAGVAAAWLLARRRSPFSAVLDAMCTLPMILPPTVLGYYLILLVGRRGVILLKFCFSSLPSFNLLLSSGSFWTV